MRSSKSDEDKFDKVKSNGINVIGFPTDAIFPVFCTLNNRNSCDFIPIAVSHYIDSLLNIFTIACFCYQVFYLATLVIHSTCWPAKLNSFLFVRSFVSSQIIKKKLVRSFVGFTNQKIF